MKKYALTMVLILISEVSYGKPIYLDCFVANKEARHDFSVKLDEENGKITHTRDDGFAFNTEGFFAPNEIVYQQVDVLGVAELTRKYIINRTILSINYTATIVPVGTNTATSTEKYSGDCTIVVVKDRKI